MIILRSEIANKFVRVCDDYCTLSDSAKYFPVRRRCRLYHWGSGSFVKRIFDHLPHRNEGEMNLILILFNFGNGSMEDWFQKTPQGLSLRECVATTTSLEISAFSSESMKIRYCLRCQGSSVFLFSHWCSKLFNGTGSHVPDFDKLAVGFFFVRVLSQ